jgi:hypothetical protein
MNQTRAVEAVEIHVAVVGTSGVQVSATSNTGSSETTSTTLVIQLPIALPSLQVGDPILTGKQ